MEKHTVIKKESRTNKKEPEISQETHGVTSYLRGFHGAASDLAGDCMQPCQLVAVRDVGFTTETSQEIENYK